MDTCDYKKCSDCGLIKSKTDFYHNGHGGWRCRCKVCDKLLHPYVNKYKTATLEQKARHCRHAREWRLRNPDRVREINRIRQKRHYFKRNERERLRKINLRATPELSKEDWQNILKKYKYKCIYCGAISGKLTVDHVIPISKGGDNLLGNIVPACLVCNSKKHDTSLLQIVKKDSRPLVATTDLLIA